MPATTTTTTATAATATKTTATKRPFASSCAAAASGAGCSEDRRITKSKRALRDAMVALTEEQGLEGFTVNDLCARADLNRGTFYNHFSSKEDLLASLEDEIIADLEAIQARMGAIGLKEMLGYRVAKRPIPLLIELFDYLRDQGGFLHAALGPHGDAAFRGRLRDCVCTTLVQSVLHERYRKSDDPFVGYYVSFYASAYLGVIERWLETGMQEGSEDMARIAMRLLFITPGEPIKL